MKKTISCLLITVMIATFSVMAAPTVTDRTYNIQKNEIITFLPEDFTSHVSGTDNLTAIKITALPAETAGKLAVGTQDITAQTTVLLTQIEQFNFKTSTDYTGTTGFGWKGVDATE